MYKATRRPNWDKPETYSKLKEYGDPDKWTFSQWAWEFLRRNQNYQKASEELMQGPRYSLASRSAEEARKWGLVTIKPWYENYGYGVECKWRSMAPRHHAAITERREIKLTLAQGEVALTFDLNELLFNKAALDLQLNTAKHWLESWLTTYATKVRRRAAQESTQKQMLFKYLRIIDAYSLEAPPTSRDIAKLLLDEQPASDDPQPLQQKIWRMKKTAQQYVAVKYRGLPPKDELRYRPQTGK